MITLRVWLPPAFDSTKRGFSSLEVRGDTGAAYISVRLVKPEENSKTPPRIATLKDDLDAEGVDNHPRGWRFSRMNESVVLRLWTQYQHLVTESADGEALRNSFHFCDVLLTAGQNIDIDPMSGASFATKARGNIIQASLATNALVLTAHANEYLKVRHW